MKKAVAFLRYLSAAVVIGLVVWGIDSAAIHSYTATNLLFALFFSLMGMFWMLLYRNKNQVEVLRVLSGSLIGGAVFTMSLFQWAFETVNKILYIVALVTMVGCFVLYLATGKRKRFDFTCFDFVFRRFEDSFNLSGLLIGLMALGVCIVQPALFAKGYVSVSSQINAQEAIDSAYPKEVTYGEECRLAENKEVIRRILDPDTWDDSTAEQRKEAAEALIRCEGRYLGITSSVAVSFSDDMKPELGGYYRDDDRSIHINNDCIKANTPFLALEVCLHEIRHCYQHDMMRVYKKLDPEERNLLPFYSTEKWLVNSVDYKRAEYDGIEEYKNQAMETDARDYSARMVVEYLELLQEMDAEEANE